MANISKSLIIILCVALVSSQKHGLMLRANQQSCKALNSQCNEDCECCGHETDTVRCEKRNNPAGYRCYTSKGIGGECKEDQECRSQKCLNGRCIPSFNGGPTVPTCSLSKNVTSVSPVKGTIQDVCKCNTPTDPITGDAENAIDGDSSTIYVNDYATNGGIEIKPKYQGGLSSFKVCNSDDCPECDPTCYKLEGYCEFMGTYETIQEGDLPLPTDRNKCVTIRTAGNPLYSSYRLTFPCQRGTCRGSCEGECHSYPVSNPKLGPCPNYVDDGTNNVGSMKFIEKVVEVGVQRTIFYYVVENIKLMYLRLAWLGDCAVDHYYVYTDLNGNGLLDENEVCCFKKCGNDFVIGNDSKEDPLLCMQGLMITSAGMTAWEPGKYIIKVSMMGIINETSILPYGMVGKDCETGMPSLPKYGQVESPKCPDILCEHTCPLKLSEISLLTKDCMF